MIPDIQSIIAMLLAKECTAEQAEAWIYTHMENSDLRDQFAAQAIAAMPVQVVVAEPAADYMARSAYKIADAMLKARQA